MLIDLRELCKSYQFIPKGILHVGAHKAEEYNVYTELGVNNVVWIEANKELLNSIKNNIPEHQIILNYLVSDVDDKEYLFKITNNGESSSLLELDKHKIHHPHIHVISEEILKSKTIDTIIKENNLNMEFINFLNLDIQGAELLALKGAKENLVNIDYVYTEINTASIYKNCALINEIDDFLSENGFYRAETRLTQYEWGDAFYVRK